MAKSEGRTLERLTSTLFFIIIFYGPHMCTILYLLGGLGWIPSCFPPTLSIGCYWSAFIMGRPLLPVSFVGFLLILLRFDAIYGLSYTVARLSYVRSVVYGLHPRS